MNSKQEITKWLEREIRSTPENWIDWRTGEISATELAEWWAECHDHEALDDETHIVWDVAVELAEKYSETE